MRSVESPEEGAAAAVGSGVTTADGGRDFPAEPAECAAVASAIEFLDASRAGPPYQDIGTALKFEVAYRHRERTVYQRQASTVPGPM